MSSYKKNNYDLVFKSLAFLLNPKKIVEIGIYEGFSLDSLIDGAGRNCEIYGYDLFEEYRYKHQKFNQIKNKYSPNRNVKIKKADFKQVYKFHEEDSIDILHVDISNNGDTYEFCMEYYFPKVSQGGVILLEGGSKDRDGCEWMNDFNFPKIRPVIEKIKTRHEAVTLEAYPSLTIIKR